jgi:hypothetical protein
VNVIDRLVLSTSENSKKEKISCGKRNENGEGNKSKCVPFPSVKSSSVPRRESCLPFRIVPESWRNGVGVSSPCHLSFIILYNASETVNIRTNNETICRGTGNKRRLDVAQVKRHV